MRWCVGLGGGSGSLIFSPCGEIGETTLLGLGDLSSLALDISGSLGLGSLSGLAHGIKLRLGSTDRIATGFSRAGG